MVGSVTRLYGDKYFILDETRISNFSVFLCHSCMYGRGNIRVSERVVELRMRCLLAWVS